MSEPSMPKNQAQSQGFRGATDALPAKQHPMLGATMLTSDAQTPPPGGGFPLVAAADLQDHLMVASHDLARSTRLLQDAGDARRGSADGAFLWRLEPDERAEG